MAWKTTGPEVHTDANRASRFAKMAGRVKQRFALTSVLALASAACTPAAVRMGPPLALTSPPAQTPCEKSEMVEAVPVQIAVAGHEAGVGMNLHYSGTMEGIGVFHDQADHPQSLEDLWEEMKEPELQRRHQARIQPVDDAHAAALYWALGGLLAMGAGLGTAAAIQEDSPTAAGVLGVSGLTLGLVAAIGVLVAQPSGYEQMQADARRQLFIPEEDDMQAATRGLSRLNQARKLRCESESR